MQFSSILRSGITVGFPSEAMTGDQRIVEIVVAPELSGTRLDRVLATSVSELSRSRLKQLIIDGQITIENRTIRDPAHRVAAGEAISVNIPPPTDPEPQPERIPLDI